MDDKHAPTWCEGEVLAVHGKDVEVALDGVDVPTRLRFMPGLHLERGHRVAICQFGYETCVTAIVGFNNPATFRAREAS